MPSWRRFAGGRLRSPAVEGRGSQPHAGRRWHFACIGKPPAAALREAQIAIWKQKRWNAPYYWAAFVLQGEWR